MLLISVPESRRQLRHRLRTRLAWAGLGSPAPGVWLTPDPTKQDEVAGVVADLGLTGVTSSFVGPFGAIGTERDVVAQAWDLAEVETAYEEFLATFGAADPDTPDEVLRHQIHLVHAWRRFPFLDPQLPAALLPDDWAGARAAALFSHQHDALARAGPAALATTRGDLLIRGAPDQRFDDQLEVMAKADGSPELPGPRTATRSGRRSPAPTAPARCPAPRRRPGPAYSPSTLLASTRLRVASGSARW